MFERLGAVADEIGTLECPRRRGFSEIDSAVLELVLQKQLHGKLRELQHGGEGVPHWRQLCAPRSTVAVPGRTGHMVLLLVAAEFPLRD